MHGFHWFSSSFLLFVLKEKSFPLSNLDTNYILNIPVAKLYSILFFWLLPYQSLWDSMKRIFNYMSCNMHKEGNNIQKCSISLLPPPKWMKWRLFHEFRRDNILERSFLFPCEGHILKLKPPPTLKGITHALSTQSMSDCCKSNIKIIKYIALVFFVNFIKMLDSSRGKKCSVWNNWMLLNDFNKFNKAKG